MSRSNRVVPLEDRVNMLFATVIDSNGVEVATATVAQALSVSEADIDALRRPGAHRPDEHLLAALARYFDMPGNFLSDDPDEYHSPYRQLSLLIAQRDKRIPFVALRPSADHLGDDALQELTNYLESLGQ
ncbi:MULTISPECIES: hypothetical protein [unclassified Nocardia]|uniref:hypothetical protein n=1 Tax=unclassified Nocardia TaxID=2637762 RepID=UPI001CE4694D|nr:MULTISPECIES: hypothetical protein [unclassified Nocardia]